MTLKIRRFASADRAALVAVIDAVCAEGRWMSTRRFEPTLDWTHALQEPLCPGHQLLVAECQGEVIGWCRLFPKDGKNEVVLGIGLLPKYRHRGLGTALVRRALHWGRDTGYQRVSLTTRLNNARAIHVFSRCGFARMRCADDGLLEMACMLSPSRGR